MINSLTLWNGQWFCQGAIVVRGFSMFFSTIRPMVTIHCYGREGNIIKYEIEIVPSIPHFDQLDCCVMCGKGICLIY